MCSSAVAITSPPGGGRIEQAVDGDVERLGTVQCEDDPLGGHCVEQLGKVPTAAMEYVAGDPGFAVSAPAGRCGHVDREVRHRVDNAAGLGETCGGIVAVEVTPRPGTADLTFIDGANWSSLAVIIGGR